MVTLSGEKRDRNAAAAEAAIAPVVAPGEPQECALLPTLPPPSPYNTLQSQSWPGQSRDPGLPNTDVSLLPALFTSANSSGSRWLLPNQPRQFSGW